MEDRHDLNYSAMSEASLLEQLLAREHRPNVLVECGTTAVSVVSSTLIRSCREPRQHYHLPCNFELPASSKGTLLLENVEALTPPQQMELHEWMTTGCLGMQVVSITAAPLATSVQRGEFLEALFYRLNVVLIDADAASTLPESRFGRTLSACSPRSTPSSSASSWPPVR